MAVLEPRTGRQPRIIPRQIGEHWPNFVDLSCLGKRFVDKAQIND